MTIRDNRLENVNFGISVTATDSLVEGNVVDTFAGDGLRGSVTHHLPVQHGEECVAVTQHDDGFQSWSVGSDGVVGRGGHGIVWRKPHLNYDDRPALRGTCRDRVLRRYLRGLVVENNVVITITGTASPSSAPAASGW
jgi:hypothetical protein